MVHALVGKRTGEDAKRFICELAGKLSGQLPLFTSDELPHYREALADRYSTDVPVARRGKLGRPPNPVRKIDPDLKYATVHKERKNNVLSRLDRGLSSG